MSRTYQTIKRKEIEYLKYVHSLNNNGPLVTQRTEQTANFLRVGEVFKNRINLM